MEHPEQMNPKAGSRLVAAGAGAGGEVAASEDGGSGRDGEKLEM